MSVHLITYDLRAPGRNYQSLHAAIRAYGTWCHALESTWLVVTNASTVDTRDALAKHIDSNDGLLVLKQVNDAAWTGLSDEVSAWLMKNLAA
jgi:hypothetical protein